jgi:hypothetical protein
MIFPRLSSAAMGLDVLDVLGGIIRSYIHWVIRSHNYGGVKMRKGIKSIFLEKFFPPHPSRTARTRQGMAGMGATIDRRLINWIDGNPVINCVWGLRLIEFIYDQRLMAWGLPDVAAVTINPLIRLRNTGIAPCWCGGARDWCMETSM